MQAHLNFFHHFLVSHREQDFADGDLGPNFISDTECSGYPGNLPFWFELYPKKKKKVERFQNTVNFLLTCETGWS